jgi:ATP-binding cassette, subfamily G (WHITE), eye pigment precursor transporter
MLLILPLYSMRSHFRILSSFFQTFGNLFAVINVFTQELPIFLREHFNGMYRVDVYYICKVLVDVPTFIVLPMVFITICYWMIGMYPDVTCFFIACAVIVLVTNAAVSFGYFISCVSGTENLALALAPTCIIPLMLFGGFFLNSGTVPKYFLWLAVSDKFRFAKGRKMFNNLFCSNALNHSSLFGLFHSSNIFDYYPTGN